MASNISLPSYHNPLLKSSFLGRTDLSNLTKPSFTFQRRSSPCHLKTYAKFNLFEILGGRGLLNGECGVEKELTRSVEEQAPAAAAGEETKKAEGEEGSAAISGIDSAEADAFEKEMMGLTGGFPGGETGLRKFIEKNPPPKKPPASATPLVSSKKPKAPELPLLLPGMIAIVSNPNSPYHMYCGIVQRITDGKAGVLFEGGNWDRLITFRLEELTRREKGPPGKNPRSAILEPLLLKDSE